VLENEPEQAEAGGLVNASAFGRSGGIAAVAEPDPLGPLNPESMASIIARRLRAAIMYGSLPPGRQLNEAELAARFGVSRGPLREAMQRLVQEGLLRSERNRGLFVVTLTPDDVRDIYTARAAVERAAASLILRRDPGQAAARLGKVHREMKKAALRTDYPAVSDADLRFHETLVAASASSRLMRMHSTLLVESRMCMRALERTYRFPIEVAEEHGALLDAIRAGDKVRLFELIDAHMQDALRRLAPQPHDVDEQAGGDAPAPRGRRSRHVSRR
jgi:DNA-binding GntR family transcriptional regulator